MALFQDDFTGTNGDDISVRTGWDVAGPSPTSAFQINAANQLKSITNNRHLAYHDVGDKDHYIQAVWRATVDGGTFIACRGVDELNFIGVRRQGTSWQMYKKVAGTFTLVTSSSGHADPAGAVVKITADASNLIEWIVDSSSIFSSTVADLSTATFVGVNNHSLSDPHIDDVEADVLGASAPTATIDASSSSSTVAASGDASINVQADAVSAASTVAAVGDASIDSQADLIAPASTVSADGVSIPPSTVSASVDVSSGGSAIAAAGSASLVAQTDLTSAASAVAADGAAAVVGGVVVASGASLVLMSGTVVAPTVVASVTLTSPASTAWLTDTSLGPYTLTVTLADASGVPLVGAIVTATLSVAAVDGGQGIVAPSEVRAVADANGVATLSLWPNARARNAKPYRIVARRADGSLLFELERRISADTTLELAA